MKNETTSIENHTTRRGELVLELDPQHGRRGRVDPEAATGATIAERPVAAAHARGREVERPGARLFRAPISVISVVALGGSARRLVPVCLCCCAVGWTAAVRRAGVGGGGFGAALLPEAGWRPCGAHRGAH